ncbi:MAG TPA: hypothetical protein VLI90_13105 [Tepidisphaeraceae bacterium]|nr:hypothetical protein [Tepidisphaeraceae bacterium]
MDRFKRLASGAVDAFDPVLYMTIAVFLRKVRRGAIRRPSHLSRKLEPLVRRPIAAERADVQVKLAKPLINLQPLNSIEVVHASS